LIDNFVNSTVTNGFTYVTTFPSPQAAVTGTTITQANPAVASATNTYSNGDQVVIYNAVGMEQISGMVFTISSVSGSAFTLLGLDSSGFASSATAFTVRRITQNPVGVTTPVAPSYLYVTKVSQAVGAQVTTSQQHNLVVGQKIEFTIPGSFGMVQLNNFYQPSNKPIIVASIVDTYNFTINIDTTGYTAFTWPTIAQQPSSFPEMTPVGEDTATSLSSPTIQVPTIAGQQIFNTNTGILADSTVNTGYLGMILGAFLASKLIKIEQARKLLRLGLLMGILIAALDFSTSMISTICLMVAVGVLTGLFLVPMNALLQHRGKVILSTGESIAVQNFCENTSIVILTSLYSAFIGLNVTNSTLLILFGVFITVLMGLIIKLNTATTNFHTNASQRER
jgi:hypothetical protein